MDFNNYFDQFSAARDQLGQSLVPPVQPASAVGSPQMVNTQVPTLPTIAPSVGTAPAPLEQTLAPPTLPPPTFTSASQAGGQALPAAPAPTTTSYAPTVKQIRMAKMVAGFLGKKRGFTYDELIAKMTELNRQRSLSGQAATDSRKERNTLLGGALGALMQKKPSA